LWLDRELHRESDAGGVDRGLAVGVIGIALAIIFGLIACATTFHWFGIDSTFTSAEKSLIKSLNNPPPPATIRPGSNDNSASSTTAPPTTQSSSTAPSRNVAEQSVQLAVLNYCPCDAPRDQAAIKVKVTVTNNTGETLDISVDRFRLITGEPLAGNWSPPPGTASIQLLKAANGDTVAAIPPNPDQVAENVPSGLTFATHWSATTLAPGMTYADPAIKQGDLVFYVPSNPDGTVTVLGLGYVTPTGQLLGYLPSTSWGTETDGNAF
jgi:hypothetical protein